MEFPAPSPQPATLNPHEKGLGKGLVDLLLKRQGLERPYLPTTALPRDAPAQHPPADLCTAPVLQLGSQKPLTRAKSRPPKQYGKSVENGKGGGIIPGSP